MSSSEYLTAVIRNLSRYFLPIVVCIGNVTLILSLIVFSRKSMRKNASSLYFLSFTLANLIFINISINTIFLFFGYQVDPTGGILFICRLEFYIGFVTSLLSSIFLVLASIDRYIMTSSTHHIQRLNTPFLAMKLIILLTIISCLVHIHAFFFITRSNKSTRFYSCKLQTGEYILVLGWYIFLVLGFLTPVLMIFFGTRTIVNVRRVMIHSPDRLHSVDRQLILIMLSQCFIHVVFRLPLPIYFLYDYMTRTIRHQVQYPMMNVFLFYIALICFCVPFCTAFFINLISRSFRAELKRLVEWFVWKRTQTKRRGKKRRQQRVYPVHVVNQQANPIQ